MSSNGEIDPRALLARRLVESGAGGAVIALPLVWLVFQPLVDTVERQAIDIGRLHSELIQLKTACQRISTSSVDDQSDIARGISIAARAIAKREALEGARWDESIRLVAPEARPEVN